VKKNSENESKQREIQQRAFTFACRIVKLYQFLAKHEKNGEIIGRQVLRSGTSIGANLEEAKAAQSKPDFISKCNIALKEARETDYWLRILMDTEVVPAGKLRPLANESNELVAILTTIVKKSKTGR
jgi:four helix bundle protein